jgi:hypothetical protein
MKALTGKLASRYGTLPDGELIRNASAGENRPEKVKALQEEGPKRGAKELPVIIGKLVSLVNRGAVRL